MQVEFRVIGHRADRRVDRVERGRRAVALDLDTGEDAQRDRIAGPGRGLDRRGGGVDPLAPHQKLASMDRGRRIVGLQRGRAQRQVERLVTAVHREQRRG